MKWNIQFLLQNWFLKGVHNIFFIVFICVALLFYLCGIVIIIFFLGHDLYSEFSELSTGTTLVPVLILVSNEKREFIIPTIKWPEARAHNAKHMRSISVPCKRHARRGSAINEENYIIYKVLQSKLMLEVGNLESVTSQCDSDDLTFHAHKGRRGKKHVLT